MDTFFTRVSIKNHLLINSQLFCTAKSVYHSTCLACPFRWIVRLSIIGTLRASPFALQFTRCFPISYSRPNYKTTACTNSIIRSFHGSTKEWGKAQLKWPFMCCQRKVSLLGKSAITGVSREVCLPFQLFQAVPCTFPYPVISQTSLRAILFKHS